VKRGTKRAFRGAVLYAADVDKLVYHRDAGLLVDEKGYIVACDDWGQIEKHVSDTKVRELPPGHVILPGLIDMHVHLPQFAVTGCQASDLLSWLSQYIFPEEAKFADIEYAKKISRWFFHELLRNGTTTAAVFLTSHQKACQIAFETAEALGNRVIMGQNLMDKNAPESILRPTDKLLAETEAMSLQWHGHDNNRLQYAWMPRFALTSSESLLQGIGSLRKKYPDIYLHTHLSEQLSEIEAVKSQFPWAKDYTSVYEQFGLLSRKTILAHDIHLSEDELERIRKTQSAFAHCPSSNFFLKSGRFHLLEIVRKKLLWGLGSDVGAGPELSMLRVMRDAQFRQDDEWIPLTMLLYGATLGAAKALFLEDSIGSLDPGKEADFIILNLYAKPGFSLADALSQNGEDAELLLSRMTYLGDDRMVAATYIRGSCVYSAS
jgi:guanine deaminase